jgi:hypothetical protein
MSSDIEQLTCDARLAKKGYYITFGNKKGRCYLEFRCSKKTTQPSGLCTSCETKNPNCRTQDTRTFEHGRVWEPIPEKSHIFGGQWYYENQEKNGEPLSVDVEAALKHQKEARKGFPPIEDMLSSAKTTKKNTASEKQNNTIMNAFDMSSSLSSLSTLDTLESARSEETSPKRKKKEVDPDRSERSKRSQKSTEKQNTGPRRKTTAAPPSDFTITLPVQVPDQIVVYPIYVEEVQEPYEIAEIEYITVTEFEYNDDLYYKCNEDNRIFEYLNDGGMGECIGIYEDDEIIDISKCDVEEEYV